MGEVPPAQEARTLPRNLVGGGRPAAAGVRAVMPPTDLAPRARPCLPSVRPARHQAGGGTVQRNDLKARIKRLERLARGLALEAALLRDG